MADGTTLHVLALEGFAFGAVNSLHCVGMCGPLAAVFLHRRTAALAYHGGRVAAYMTVGALAGALGLALGAGKFEVGGAWFAFALALSLLLMACGFEKVLGRVPGLGRLAARISARMTALRPDLRGFGLGVITPLLPCGLLYAACAAAMATGGPLRGAISMAGFAAGAIPLLLLAQWNLGHLTRRFGPKRMRNFARAAMVIAAIVLTSRGVSDLRARNAGGAGGCCSESPAAATGD